MIWITGACSQDLKKICKEKNDTSVCLVVHYDFLKTYFHIGQAQSPSKEQNIQSIKTH